MKEPDPHCEFCKGRGTVRYPVWDDDVKKYVDVGERECVCRLNLKEEPDDNREL